MNKRYERGYRIDCRKNGCAEPHEDDGNVMLVSDNLRHPWTKVNGHAITWVIRSVAYTEWQEDER